MIGQGQLTMSGITAQDVVRALDIWGPESVKGKTASHKAQLEEEQNMFSQHILNF